MIDIIIESPFLSKRKITLDETKWTIGKLTNTIASKIKVLGQLIDPDNVCYELQFQNGENYQISKTKDYPMDLKDFIDKLANMEHTYLNKLLTIKVTFSERHFDSVSRSVKLLEIDTLDNFINRRFRRKSVSTSVEIVNIESIPMPLCHEEDGESKVNETEESDLELYGVKYIEYKTSVNNKWKNVLKDMKTQGMIGVKKDLVEIKNVLTSSSLCKITDTRLETNDNDMADTHVDNCEFLDNSFGMSMEIRPNVIRRRWSIYKCIKHLCNKQPNHKSSHSKQQETMYEPNYTLDTKYNDELSYHDNNIIDDKETEGNMFYTWNDDDDFLVD